MRLNSFCNRSWEKQRKSSRILFAYKTWEWYFALRILLDIYQPINTCLLWPRNRWRFVSSHTWWCWENTVSNKK